MLAAVHYGEFGLPEPLAVLDTVLVDRDFAGRGIARAMYEQLVRNLQALRIERLRTEVAWDDHELVAFFGRMGLVAGAAAGARGGPVAVATSPHRPPSNRETLTAAGARTSLG